MRIIFKRSGKWKLGFSLTEVSLALLVVAVGILGLFGLFPAGLDMSKKAIDETYAAFFADSTFASLRDAAFYEKWDELDDYLAIAPNTFANNQDVFWKDSENLRVIGDGQVYTNIYTASSTMQKWDSGFPLPGDWQMEDHAFKFSLQLTDAPQPDGMASMLKQVTLKIWLDRYADETKVQPLVFYTEIFRHNRDP